MYYQTLPQAPVALVSGISAVLGLPTITDARAGKNGQVFLEVLALSDEPMSTEQLVALAEYCEVDIDDICWSKVEIGKETVFVLSISGTTFDFDYMFPESTPVNTGDSEESWQASEALAAGRSS